MLLPLLTAAMLTAAPSAPVTLPGETEAQRFKVLFEKGEALYQAGEFGAAIWNFKQADRQRVTPEVAYDLAKCHEKIGDVAYTLYYYRLYMRRAPKAPDALDVAEKVGDGLTKAENEGRGFLELDAPRAEAVVVNGRRYPEPPVAVLLPPGDYEVDAEFPTGRRTMQVSIMAGRTASVTFEPVQPPVLAMENALSAEAVARGADAAGAPRPSGLRIGSFVTIGVGAAALGAGIALGVLSAADAAKSKDKTLTLKEARGYAVSADGKAIAANVSYGAAGVAAAGAVLMFIFSMPEPGVKPAGGQ